jgi:glutathione-specific gamma-glutamylcyclotransferase
MSLDTTAINGSMDLFDGHHQVWLFGYGSLIFKADFPFLDRRQASLPGWQRRFWQGSHDHRGTPDAPGRVLTLTAAPGEVCDGMAYLITPAVFAHLDHREKNGYLRLAEEIVFDDGSRSMALIYIADEHNAAWLGPADDDTIARQIATSEGPSGRNSDYLLELDAALRALGKQDAHVLELAARVRRLVRPSTPVSAA